MHGIGCASVSDCVVNWAALLYTCTVFSFYVMILLSQGPNVVHKRQTGHRPSLWVRPGFSISDR